MLGATTWTSMSWNPRLNMCYMFFRDAVWWLRHCHLLHSACKFKFLQFGTCVPVRISSWWFTSASGDRILNAIRLHKRVNSVHFECSQLKSHCLVAGSAAERRLFVLAERVACCIQGRKVRKLVKGTDKNEQRRPAFELELWSTTTN